MNKQPSVFDFQDQPVRVIDRDNAPWFVAADVCRVLEIANPRDAVSSLEEDEKMTVGNSDGQAGKGAQSFNIVSESGLYALIFKSRKPQAKAFRKWVTAEVLPAIRKTGSYELPPQVEQAPALPTGIAAIRLPVTIPAFLDATREQHALSLRDQIRFGNLVRHMAKAFGVPFALTQHWAMGHLRAYPEGLCYAVLQQMKVATIAPAVDPDLGDLLASVASSMGEDVEVATDDILEAGKHLGFFPQRPSLKVDLAKQLGRKLQTVRGQMLTDHKGRSFQIKHRRTRQGARYLFQFSNAQ